MVPKITPVEVIIITPNLMVSRHSISRRSCRRSIGTCRNSFCGSFTSRLVARSDSMIRCKTRTCALAWFSGMPASCNSSTDLKVSKTMMPSPYHGPTRASRYGTLSPCGRGQGEGAIEVGQISPATTLPSPSLRSGQAERNPTISARTLSPPWERAG